MGLVKHSDKFKSRWSRKNRLGIGEYSKEDLWGFYVKWKIKYKYNQSFEQFCYSVIDLKKQRYESRDSFNVGLWG